MKILAAGDLHGDIRLAESLAIKASQNNVDYVVLCGDLVASEKNVENIIGAFAKRKQRLLMIPGNHESSATVDFLAQAYNQTNLHGYSIKKDDVGFFGCSAANIGIHSMNEPEIFNMLKKGHNYLSGASKRIMVTHTHPKGSLMEKFSSFVKGSEGITQAIYELKPDMLLCSHVHEAEGLEEMVGHTKVINVGREGKIIDI